ncbi:MAG TPA: MFS transporter [Polyangiaceae bacterium LLY-WYZ-15_(1-7)]|nr:MFS transporter [Polyangiaceae bacterium LLY-WYZ-15_(1-7)]
MLLNPDRPFRPRRLPFFYGWVIVGVGTLGVLASIPGQTMGVSVFTDALIDATGLTRLQVANAYLAGTLLSGLTLPFGGARLDRLGARATAALAALALGATLLYLSHVDAIGDALGGGVPAVLALVVGFFCLRFSGQGMLTMVSRTMLGKWFDRRRGLASGISGVFVSFGFGAAPLLFDAWIGRAGWRGAWREMALVVGLGMAALALLLYRDNPERCGLRMDGDPAATPEEEEARARTERAYTRGQALRTLAFWALTFAMATQALVITGITFHIVDLSASAGMDRSAAVAIFLPMSVVSTVVGLAGGALADRLPVRALLVTMMLAQGAAVFACAHLDSLFWLAVAGFGISGGLFNPLGTVAYPRFFGRRHLGSIVGVEMMCLVVASALGPSLLAASREHLGTYLPALYGCLALPALAIVLGLLFRHPRADAPSRDGVA